MMFGENEFREKSKTKRLNTFLILFVYGNNCNSKRKIYTNGK